MRTASRPKLIIELPHVLEHISTASCSLNKPSSDIIKCGWYIFLFCDIFSTNVNTCKIEAHTKLCFLMSSTPFTTSLYRCIESSESCSIACFCSHSRIFLGAVTQFTTCFEDSSGQLIAFILSSGGQIKIQV